MQHPRLFSCPSKPLAQDVLDAMQDWVKGTYSNPTSSYTYGPYCYFNANWNDANEVPAGSWYPDPESKPRADGGYFPYRIDTIPTPSTICLLMDYAEWTSATVQRPGYGNHLAKGVAAGANELFMDGHAEWKTPSQQTYIGCDFHY